MTSDCDHCITPRPNCNAAISLASAASISLMMWSTIGSLSPPASRWATYHWQITKKRHVFIGEGRLRIHSVKAADTCQRLRSEKKASSPSFTLEREILECDALYEKRGRENLTDRGTHFPPEGSLTVPDECCLTLRIPATMMPVNAQNGLLAYNTVTPSCLSPDQSRSLTRSTIAR